MRARSIKQPVHQLFVETSRITFKFMKSSLLAFWLADGFFTRVVIGYCHISKPSQHNPKYTQHGGDEEPRKYDVDVCDSVSACQEQCRAIVPDSRGATQRR